MFMWSCVCETLPSRCDKYLNLMWFPLNRAPTKVKRPFPAGEGSALT